MFDYPSLITLSTIVREGSFERAATALNISASAISQRIKLLEERVGEVLIVRGQPCLATKAGRQLCRHVEQVEMLEQELIHQHGNLWESDDIDKRVTLPIAVNSDSLAIWFVKAATNFANETGHYLDIVVEDEEHTTHKLESGEVFGAVTATNEPVTGCQVKSLGSVTYCATASPEFCEKYFADGFTVASFSKAPGIVYNSKDRLQHQWVTKAIGKDVQFPCHWLPSTQGFVDATMLGLGWGMNPVPLVEERLKKGELIELVPGCRVEVELFWQSRRISAKLLASLNRLVVRSAKKVLTQKI